MRFLLVDRILELDPLKRIVTAKEIRKDEDYFADHFPGYPIVPGVLQVEMMAQSAGKCLMAGLGDSVWPVLVQVRQANFRKTVLPGSMLRIEARIMSSSDAIASASAQIWSEGELMADAAMMFAFIKKDLLREGYQDEVLSAFLRETAASSSK